MTDRAATLIKQLGLMPHPEGGYFRELHQSRVTVVPTDARGSRSALTTIYFLLPAGAVSRWHRVQSDEVWHFYEGSPVELWIASPSADQAAPHTLGPLDNGSRPVRVVPGGSWQAARSTGEYSLVGCTVGPGFDFADFTLASDAPDIRGKLQRQPPPLADFL